MNFRNVRFLVASSKGQVARESFFDTVLFVRHFRLRSSLANPLLLATCYYSSEAKGVST
jgi:hypothetical protein